jgi:hypothetical protein
MLFDGFARALRMRRYRCPLCGCVIRLRPDGYFTRHQCDAETIRRVLAQRIRTGRWLAGCAANRGRHWLLALKRNAMACFGMQALCDLMSAFDRLVAMGRVPVSRAV